MNISVPSRFACLRIEGEDENPKKIDKKIGKPKKTVDKKTDKEPKKGTKEIKQVISKKEKKSSQALPQKQWEEWKEKDDQLVNGSYQKDLEDAILLSKLDYEEKKNVYEAVVIVETNKKSDKKKKTTKTISLNKFLEKIERNEAAKEKEKSKPEEGANFFEKVKSDMAEELTKEKLIEKRKNRDADIENVITASQYQERLKMELNKNDELETRVSELEAELHEVKMKNEELEKIMRKSELKEKGEILLEVERLNTIKNDLTEEVTKLHTEVEQERSKVAFLTSELLKNKNKKSKK